MAEIWDGVRCENLNLKYLANEGELTGDFFTGKWCGKCDRVDTPQSSGFSVAIERDALIEGVHVSFIV